MIAQHHKDETKVRAGHARWSGPLAGFRKLWAIRGGFSQGTRHNAIYYFAVLLRKNRVPDASIITECMALAKLCRPEVRPDEAIRRVQASKKVLSHVRHYTFVRDLKITQSEIKQLPMWFKTGHRSQGAKIAERRAALARVIESADECLSVREITRRMLAQGIATSSSTVATDLKAVQDFLLNRPIPSLSVQAERNWTPTATAQGVASHPKQPESKGAAHNV